MVGRDPSAFLGASSLLRFFASLVFIIPFTPLLKRRGGTSVALYRILLYC
jgi:hypothetical protein